MKNETVGVVRLGQLGRGITACLLGHGFKVVGYARNASEHSSARDSISRAMQELVVHARFDSSRYSTWTDRFISTHDWKPLASCGFVIESVQEDLV